MTFNSIKLWLLVSINLLMIIILGMTAPISYHNSLHEMDEIYDAQLAQTARLLWTLYKVNPNKFSEDLIVIPVPTRIDTGEQLTSAQERMFPEHKYESKIAFQIWRNEKLILLSENATSFLAQSKTEGFHEIAEKNYKWITFSLFDPVEDIWVYTSQREDVRSEMSGHMAATQIRPLLLLIIPLSILIYFIIGLSLRPLSHLSQQLRDKKPEKLTEVHTNLPSELKPIQVAINGLLKRITLYLDKEKRFIIDASHELRTPLSILQLHAQNLNSDLTEQEKQQAISAIDTGSKRMVHLVNQLLAMARIEQSSLLAPQRLNVNKLLEQSMSQLSIHQLEKVRWSSKVDRNCEVYGDPSLLQIVLRNLLDNAAKYSEQEQVVEIEVTNVQENNVLITIKNNNNITMESDRLGERFYRHSQHQHISGAGLGLSIVMMIIDLHQGQITFTQQKEQFEVKIILSSS